MQKPYQFMVKDSILDEALLKTQNAGLSLAPFMRMALEQFVKRPVIDSVNMLKKHQESKRRKR